MCSYFLPAPLYSSCALMPNDRPKRSQKPMLAGVDEVHDVDAQLVEEAEALDIYRKKRNQRMFFS